MTVICRHQVWLAKTEAMCARDGEVWGQGCLCFWELRWYYCVPWMSDMKLEMIACPKCQTKSYRILRPPCGGSVSLAVLLVNLLILHCVCSSVAGIGDWAWLEYRRMVFVKRLCSCHGYWWPYLLVARKTGWSLMACFRGACHVNEVSEGGVWRSTR